MIVNFLTLSTARLLVLTVLVLCASVGTWAQLTITQAAFPGGTALDISNYPTVRAQIKVTSNGTPTELSASAFSIVETNTAYNPVTVTYSGNGIHVVQWVPIRFGFLQCTLFASHNGSTASTNFFANVGKVKGAQVAVHDSMSRIVPKFVDFGRVPPGASDTIKLKIAATEAALSGNPPQERPVLLESVTTTRPEIKVIWKGSYGSGSLPTQIISPLEYRIDLVCEPTSDEPLYDVLTVTFEGGMRTTVMVIANPPSYPRRTILAVTSPNGGEHLAPCQNIPITWTGMVKGFKSHVEMTTNNGRTWEYIDSTMDSSLIWKVPDSYSDSVRIRVYQKFEASQSIWLKGDEVPVTNIAYSADGRYVLAAYSNGSIIEWDVVTATKVKSYSTVLGGVKINGLTYVGSSRSFVALLTRANSKGGILQRFDPSSGTPVTTGNVPNDMAVADVGSSADGSTVILLPNFASRIPYFDAVTLEKKSEIVLSGTAASTTLNGVNLAAVLLSGEVLMYNSVTQQITNQAQTGLAEGLGPYGRMVASSQSGRLVAIAGPSLEGVANSPDEQRTFIYDMQEKQVVKIVFREGSDVVNLAFSPSDAFLALGFVFNPQFVVYDLATARTLPPTGSSAGHMNDLTDIAFGPDAASVVTSSADSTNNLLLRRVSVPESDMSDQVLSISPVVLAITPIVLNAQQVATQSDTTITVNVCNVGKTLAVFTSAKAMFGDWFAVMAPAGTDTIAPGECLSLSLRVFAKDTGLLTDTVELYSCGVRFTVPVSITVSDRNLEVVTMVEDFADLCVGASKTKKFTLLRNNDGIPVRITNVYVQGGLTSAFSVTPPINDTTLAPGATLDVQITYTPTDLGLDTGVVIVRYEDLDSVQRTMLVTGRGSGAELAVSHNVLPFIPEITERIVTITNNSNNEVHLTSASITAGAPFELRTPMPQTLIPGSTIEIRIGYMGGAVDSNAYLEFAAEPCASQTKVRLTLYNGSAAVGAPVISSDPRNDTAAIPIYATITEAVPYKGIRTYQGVLRVNPELYLAHSITTTIGTATIVSQEIVNGWREIVFTVDGSFEGSGEIARLVGYAGMARDDSSRLWFDSLATAFGSSVAVTYADGLLRIVHPDPNRRIVHKQAPFTIVNLYPMPATDGVTLTIYATESKPATLKVVDANGVVIATEKLSLLHGTTASRMQTSNLLPGMYILELSSDVYTTRTQLVVVR